MAWYEMKGAGLPAGLQNNMDSVLNKKFGTSTTYAPATWPDNVNLLGPLPEKTVSGAVASFSDGADDVPLKNCIATVNANLSGVSSVGVVHAHKSLINFVGNVRTTTSAGLTMEATTSGGIRMHGTTTQTYAYLTSRFDCFLKAGATYTFSRDVAKGYRILLNCTYADTTTGTQAISANATSKTFTPDKDIVQIRLETANMTNATAYDDTILFMVETGETATDFEKYVAPETHTVQLGRTIYGGSVDVVNGQGTETAGKAVFTGSETWQLYSNETFWYTTLAADNIKVQQNCTTSNGVIVRYQSSSGQLRVYLSQNVGVVDTQTDMNALLSNGVSFAYPYDTPEDFTFTPTPINSFLGDNNIWCDSGDTEVTYRADIALALAALQGNRSLGLMRAAPEEPEEDPEEPEER